MATRPVQSQDFRPNLIKLLAVTSENVTLPNTADQEMMMLCGKLGGGMAGSNGSSEPPGSERRGGVADSGVLCARSCYTISGRRCQEVGMRPARPVPTEHDTPNAGRHAFAGFLGLKIPSLLA